MRQPIEDSTTPIIALALLPSLFNAIKTNPPTPNNNDNNDNDSSGLVSAELSFLSLLSGLHRR